METSETSPPPSTRRTFLARAGGAGTALVIGGAVLPWRSMTSAFAQEADELEPTTLAAFAQSVELAAVEAYGEAIGKLGDAGAVQLLNQLVTHHRAHAEAMGQAAGAEATGAANPTVLRAIRDQLVVADDKDGVLRIALDIENASASTYLFAVSQMTDESIIAVATSIMLVASQQAVAVGQMLGLPVGELMPPSPDPAKLGEPNAFETKDRALEPATHPLPQA